MKNDFIQTVLWLLDHKKDIAGVLLSIHAAAVHTYIMVWHAGGYRTLWRNFQGPAKGTDKTNGTDTGAPTKTIPTADNALTK